jgi:flagellar motor switch protein FliN/FliY
MSGVPRDEQPGADEERRFPDPDPAERTFDDLDADEISLEELDPETAGLFEVTALGGTPPQDEPETPDAAGPVYEVEAARAGPSPASPSPPRAPAAPSQAGPSRAAAPSSTADGIRRLHDVEVEVIATLGTTRMQIKDILGLHVGSVVELHRLVGESIDVTLNGRMIARGEVVVVDEKFAIRINEIVGNGE